jgi:arylsulfatase A-like enzyme
MRGGASLVASSLVGNLLSTLASQEVSAETLEQPHILCIVLDDMGWKDVGYHGPDIKTPNIDKLATEGARLEQFYAQPMCAPTRAALMTGRYPLRYGLRVGVIPGAATYSLPLDEYLLPQLLKDAGYKTYMSGKWRLGHAKKEFKPNHRGFDSFYEATVGEIDHFTHSSHGVKDWFRDDNARVISEHDAKKPMFLYLAFTAPHTPFQAPQEYLDRNKSIPDENRRAYAAMIAAVDDEIGKVLAELEKHGMRERTLSVFLSDNGGVKSSLFTGDTKVAGNLPANNGSYRDGKGTDGISPKAQALFRNRLTRHGFVGIKFFDRAVTSIASCPSSPPGSMT